MPLKLLKGIQHFKNHQFQEKQEAFIQLSKGQSPDVLFITCSDSRIVPTLFTHADLGELFVIRNAGNIIAPHSAMPSGEGATLEFALEHLNVSEIIVCGHSHCGAMKGLMTPGLAEQLPATAAWLHHAKPALDQLHNDHSQDLALQHLTQKNILLQIEHLKTHPAVIKKMAAGTLKFHGWYYEFEKGEIYIHDPKQNAFISFEKTVAKITAEKLQQVVKEEALAYLHTLRPQNADDLVILKQFSRLNAVDSIWNHIEKKVRLKLEQELGALFLTADGVMNTQFNDLLKSGRLIHVCNTTSTSRTNIHFFHCVPQEKLAEKPCGLKSKL